MKIVSILYLNVLLLCAYPANAQFQDVTNTQFGFPIYNEGTLFGNGLSFFDFNQDGFDDITIADGSAIPHFFQNINGQLSEIELGITNVEAKQFIMLLWADYDNDGDNDLLTTRDGAPVQLWNNNGNMEFTNVAAASGLEQENLSYWGAAFGDYDHDGCLDLFIAKYYSQYFNPGPIFRSRLYHNNCDGTFTEVTLDAGIDLPPKPVFQPVFADYNNDGWEDLVLIIDRVQFSNEIYRNNGDGTFTNQTVETSFGLNICSMSGSVADFDQDLDDDIFISNGPNGNLLMKNEAGIEFTEVAEEYGISTNVVCWGGVWIDYDNNTWEDLFIGATYPVTEPLGNWFYINNEGLGFSDGLPLSGFEEILAETHASAKGDLNNDGYYDMVWSVSEGMSSMLWENMAGDNHYLSIELEGVWANRNGIGSRITCHAGGKVFQRYTHAGENFLGQDSGKEIFGLDSIAMVDSLIIQWNSGTRDVFVNLNADQLLHVREGDSFIQYPEISFEGDSILCFGDSILLDAGIEGNVLWNTGDTTQWITVTNEGWYFADVTDAFLNVLRTDSIYIVVEPIPDASISTTPFTCHNSHDGVAVIEINETDYQEITWDNGVQNLEATFWDPGLHSCTWTDIYGCTHVQSFELSAPAQMQLNLDVTDVSCFGGNDGACVIIASGGTPPYEFNCGGDCSQLTAGKWYASVTDANGCVQSSVFFIQEPSPILITAITDGIECANAGFGSVSIDISGGVEPYQIDWMSENPALLTAGDYSVEVVDANDCPASQEFSILQADSFNVEIEIQHVLCYDYSNGTVSATYPDDVVLQWDVTDTTSFTAGVHSLTATNANGCVQEYSFEVTQPDDMICAVTSTPFIGDTVQGTAVVEVTGGTPDYDYEWSVSSENDSSVTLTASGLQWVYVQDQFGCNCYTEFFVDFIFGVQEFKSEFSISPVPANDRLSITGFQHPVKLTVFDASGHVVYVNEHLGSSVTIETTTWSEGMYFIEMHDSDQIHRSPFLIIH